MDEERMVAEEELYLAPEANDADASIETDEITTADEAGVFTRIVDKTLKKPVRVNEIRELRTEDRKVFRMSDGTEQTVVYSGAVHVFDEDANEFTDVDNTLTMDEDGRHYRNARGRFRAAFSCEEDNDVLFSMEQGMHHITVSSKKSGKRRNRGVKPALHKAEEGTARRCETLVFENVEAGTDFEYSVTANGVKENILVKERAEVYRYPFTLHCENVTVKFDEAAKRVAFLSNETGEEVFFIPAPFMKDANGDVSTGVFYEVKDVTDGNVQLTVTADSGWINAEGRAFPITIDPQILLYGSSGLSTYSWKAGNMYNAAYHVVGATGNGNGTCCTNRMYMNLKMPSLPRNPRIKKAELTFYQKNGASLNCACPKIGLYQVTEMIRTGSCTPANDADLIDFERMKVGKCESDNTVAYTFDVTRLFDELNKGESSHHRLVLKVLDESTACNNSVTLYGSADSNYSPQIALTYETSYGVNTSYRTHTHEIGRFGQGSIDLACGNLMFESEDFAWAGNRMPVTIRHVFNSALSGYQYTANSAIQLAAASFDAMKIGHGFKLNVMQSMMHLDNPPIAWTEEERSNGCMQKDGYVYIGENGDEMYFKQSTAQCCLDSNNQCYYLYEDAGGGDAVYDPEKRTLNQGGETCQFDTSGRLIRVTDEHGNHMDITYTSGRITSVTDGAGRDFSFAYNTDGFLTSITAPDGTHITYAYDGNQLADITYHDGRKAVISWSGNKPASVILQDAGNAPVYKVEYAFSGARVSSVTEYGVENGTYVIGNTSAYSYSAAARRTIVQTTEQADQDAGESDNTVLKTVYTFDDDGNIISEYVYSEDMGSVGVEGEESGIHPHSGDGGAGVVSNITNLLLEHNFESLTGWSSMPGNCYDFGISNYAYEPYTKYGKKLLRMQSYCDCTENGVYQVTNVLPAGRYTFSVYMRVQAAFSGTDTPGAYIRVCDTADNVLAISERVKARDTEYVRLIAPFELTAAQGVKVEILMDGKGTVYADAAQLENNPYANAYNMLNNGNFERGTNGWTTFGGALSSETRFDMSQSLCLAGNLSYARYAYQKVTVRTNRSTRETFTLSGWAKGCGIVNREREGVSDALFRLRAVVKYYDTTYREYGTETFTADFAPCTEEWQYASVQFAKSKYRTIQDVTVYCDYSYNTGVAYFDNIQLVRDSLETYLSASDFSVESTGESDEAVETETDSAPTFAEKTDEWGNALTETTFTDGEFGTIYRSFGFTESCNGVENCGNDLIRETDARGGKTYYDVDEDTSRNEVVTDRCGNKTAYEYDAMGRTTRVISKDAGGTELANVSYAYDAFDNLTEIARGDGMKYVLAYNAFHDLQSIGIEGKTENLVSYAYKNGNGRLKSVTYANGDTMKASYNSVGQMVAEKWYDADGALTAHYKYTYDDQGNIVRSIDMTAGKEYNYTYEEGKLVRAAECGITLSGEIVTAKSVVNTIKYYYDTEGKLIRKVITPASGSSQTIYYENGDGNTVVKFAAGGRTVTSHSKSDSFGRKVFDELQLGTDFVSRQFTYHAGKVTDEHKDNAKVKSSATTQLVSQITFSDGRTLSYAYDAEERIAKITDSIEGVTEYTYDAMGQLLTETVNGEVVNTMTYDSYGNIVSKNGVAYTYGDSVWKDRLTAYDGEAITYDAQGNPVNYLGHTLTWEKGRQLKSFDNIRYTYNANGIRTSKTVNGVEHTYTLDDTKILRETWGNNVLIPLYDNEDSVCGVLYNNTPFYFQKNLQGDVIAIANADGSTVARYSYDAWGKCTVLQDTSGCYIASVNPFRYRSYYYDSEIGMYYLQSRYYDPEVGRFLNADDPGIVNNASDYSALSANKYCYCLNSPINNSDEYGSVASVIIKMISNFFWGMAGGMLGMYLANVTLNVVNGKKQFYEKNDTWGQYIAEGIKAGAFAIFGSKLVYKIIAVIGASVLKQVVDFFFNKTAFNLWQLLLDIIIGICAVIAIHFAPTILSKLPKSKRGNSGKFIEKIKAILTKIADYIMKKLKKVIENLIKFFKNVFVKRFSISYAKKIGSELLKIFK